MKPLLLSFFAVILCYSLFFDRKRAQIHVDEINYTIQPEAYETSYVPDTLLFYADRSTLSVLIAGEAE